GWCRKMTFATGPSINRDLGLDTRLVSRTAHGGPVQEIVDDLPGKIGGARLLAEADHAPQTAGQHEYGQNRMANRELAPLPALPKEGGHERLEIIAGLLPGKDTPGPLHDLGPLDEIEQVRLLIKIGDDVRHDGL